MTDLITGYKGIDPTPIRAISWEDAIQEIRDGTHQKKVLAARKAKHERGEDAYRVAKTKLPSVSFGGTFDPSRKNEHTKTQTGFIVADIDHIGDVESTFDLIKQDEKIWFAFRSPGGDGIKAGLRAKGITNDEAHKVFYDAIERYFLDVYGIAIDPACKDICRLTFMSWDEASWINPSPVHFNIPAWATQSPFDATETEYTPTSGDLQGPALYATKVLISACDAIRASVPGNQHAVRLRKSRLVGGYMHYGLDESHVLESLENAVRESGAKNIAAAMKTIRDGLAHGQSTPIHLSNGTNGTNGTNAEGEKLTQLTDFNAVSPALVSKLTQPNASMGVQKGRFQGNLTGAIRQYIKENQGSFSTDQLDRDLGLVDQKDKNLRRQAINACIKEKSIKRDLKTAGRYHIIRSEAQWIDLQAVSGENFHFTMPLGLSDMVNIPTKCICVLAGTSNAGKTAFLLNLIHLNLHSKYGLLYLMSEMGPSEYFSRVTSLTTDISLWNEKVRAAAITTGFDGIIANHNPNGLSVIDFLEDSEGKYFEMASEIRNIYDSLENGIAWIALQKHSQATVGRGGEGTTEKARLYLTIDTLVHQPKCTISALRIVKAKDYPDENPNGKELHIRIIGGHTIEVVPQFGRWQYVNSMQRQKWVTQYEHMLARGIKDIEPDREAMFKFLCTDGEYQYIVRRNVDMWQESFDSINVEHELANLSRWSEKNPMDKKSYFHMLAAMLRRKHESNGPDRLQQAFGQ